MRATMFAASVFASRIAFWAVGPCGRPSGSSTFGITAQSPIAYTPGWLVSIVARVTARPARSTSTPEVPTSGSGRTPPVQMTVRVGIACRSSPTMTASSVTSLMAVPSRMR